MTLNASAWCLQCTLRATVCCGSTLAVSAAVQETRVSRATEHIYLSTPKALVTSQLPTTTFPADVTLIIKDLGLQGEALLQ